LHVAKYEAIPLRIDDVNPVMLDDHQQRIVTKFCERGGLCIMTGVGGHGKSQVNMAIKQKLGNLVVVTAMTGTAVSLINGCTLHSVAHFPIKKQHKCALSKGKKKFMTIPEIFGRGHSYDYRRIHNDGTRNGQLVDWLMEGLVQ
jgi:hypothetical protein